MGREQADDQPQRFDDAGGHAGDRFLDLRNVRPLVSDLLHHVPFMAYLLHDDADHGPGRFLVVLVGVEQGSVVEDRLPFSVLQVMHEYGEGEDERKELKERYPALEEEGNPERDAVDVSRNGRPLGGMTPLHHPYFGDDIFPAAVAVPRRQKRIQAGGDDLRRPECAEQAKAPPAGRSLSRPSRRLIGFSGHE